MDRAPTRSFGVAPSAEDIAALARAALAALPEPFAGQVGEVLVAIEELAEDAVLADLGIDDPFELTGLYHGVALTAKSVEDWGGPPDRVTLYRRAILDEWAEGEEALERLVHHVLIHEIGHHFGLSDADIERLEREGE